MDNKTILKMLCNPMEYIEKPIWVDMVFSIKRIMEDKDIYQKQLNNNAYNLLHLTINQYLDLINNKLSLGRDKITINCTITEINDYQDLSYFLSDWTYGEIWAYSMKELEYCREEKKNICVVILANGKEVLAELPLDEYIQNIKNGEYPEHCKHCRNVILDTSIGDICAITVDNCKNIKKCPKGYK